MHSHQILSALVFEMQEKNHALTKETIQLLPKFKGVIVKKRRLAPMAFISVNMNYFNGRSSQKNNCIASKACINQAFIYAVNYGVYLKLLLSIAAI